MMRKFFPLLTGVLFFAIAEKVQCAQVVAEITGEEREFKTFVDRTKKMLAGYGCLPLSEKNYPDVFKSVQELLAKCAVGSPEVFVVEADSNAEVALRGLGINAFNNAWSFAKNGVVSMIILDKGLVDLLTVQELKCIIAHEIGHILYKSENGKKECRLKKIYMYTSWGLAVPFLGYAVYRSTFPNFSERISFLPACLVAYMLGGSNILFARWRSRCEEKSADLRAIALAQSKDLASALEKMRKRDAEFYPVSVEKFKWWEKWFPCILDHPTLQERKKYIEACRLPEIKPVVTSAAA